MHHSESIAISTGEEFEQSYRAKVQLLLMSPPVHRGPAHATTDETMALTHELMYVTEAIEVPETMGVWQTRVDPNLPWAEDHFQERIGGQPLNPSPSEAWWPFARQGNAEHKKEQVFSHTYPERFWPKRANKEKEYETLYADDAPAYDLEVTEPRQGIRYEYGDLHDLIRILVKNPRSRQAYLPIWFPEDLAAGRMGLRVPCSMGYHFIWNASTQSLDCVYTMRSCDVVRFYRDDIYMAGRLLQHVAEEVDRQISLDEQDIVPGKLMVHIDNLHCFPGDRSFLESKYLSAPVPVVSKRDNYNWGALG